uniref:ATP synthase complex subunit 8 n=1 Tax=Lophiomus setigerus TaxID=292417 RepID=Q8HM75_LOPSE|nr:ATP synthase F0 subunit 8 [Lophiomus setigerus]UIP57061.1 ATP synthase F0 subunit 8 [Lophius litulon]BAC23285.1 ATPase subunit 8 [Lophiomus setigerus]
MPQLDLSPWFLVLFLTWSVFLLIVPQKVLAHSFPFKPNSRHTKTTNLNNWNWSWH